MKKGYNYQDFRDDVKTVFKLTGIHKKRLVFFLSDNDIAEVVFSYSDWLQIINIFTKESFLEDLDSLLSSGNIPELFDTDELER
jgi:dynein heavy chain, axonemal